MKAESQITVTVAYSPAARVLHEISVALPASACVKDALAAAAQNAMLTDALPAEHVGLWGKRVSEHQTLQNGDRVEIYRPLKVDPKVARRERFKKQGAKSAGLFAQRRPGAKAGY
jgi:uncharacterized protein